MEVKKERIIKRIFYLLLFILFILIFLLWLPFLVEQKLSCEDSPGSVSLLPSFIYKISGWVKSIESILGKSLFIVSLVLFIFGFFQKGTLRIIGIILPIIVSLIFISIAGDRSGARDSRRIADLRQFREILNRYYDENKKYPGISGSNQWDILNQIIIDKYHPETIIQDPCYKINPEWTYEYWVSPDNQEFVLKANLQSWWVVLNDDLDGDILGTSCGKDGFSEREYCIGSSF